MAKEKPKRKGGCSGCGSVLFMTFIVFPIVHYGLGWLLNTSEEHPNPNAAINMIYYIINGLMGLAILAAIWEAWENWIDS